MDIDDDVIDLSQIRDDFDLGYPKTNQNSFGNINSNLPFQFNSTNNNSSSFFQTDLNKNNVTNSNNGGISNNNIQLPFNSMDDESDTEILIPLTNGNII